MAHGKGRPGAMAAVLAAVAAARASAGGMCTSTTDCSRYHMCIRGACQMVFRNHFDLDYCGQLDAECCSGDWPNITSCVLWYETSTHRICESNSVPPYYVAPYCPYGIGQGYCQPPTDGDSTDCDPFRDMVCPCNATDPSCESTTTGDVMVPAFQYFKFPLNPDPTDSSKPKHMYDDPALKNGNTFQVIGAHLNGVQIKGPAEANGYNVDTSLIPLGCGGHITPPVGTGPLYHYHKAADCQDITSPGSHGPLIGYASDGFAFYGFGDFQGTPVLDECHGHFGPVDEQGTVEYHYHVSAAYNLDGVAHKPYYMGCQGPSKGQCNSTVNEDYDAGANWCGEGCGFELCVQPGTDQEALAAYLSSFSDGVDWFNNFTVNEF